MKVTIQENARIIVDVDENQFIKDQQKRFEDQKNNAAWLVESIRRHCDGYRGVSIEWDTEDRCEHCGAVWTEGDSPHNGGCCDKDIDALEAAILAGATITVPTVHSGLTTDE